MGIIITKVHHEGSGFGGDVDGLGFRSSAGRSTDDAVLAGSQRYGCWGHIASYFLNPRSGIVDYCWPDTEGITPGTCVDTGGPSGTSTPDGVVEGFSWTLNPVTGGGVPMASTGGEWINSGFEEGFATFLGDRAIYRQAASQPLSCASPGACIATSPWQQLERSTGNGATQTCQNNLSALRRSPLMVVRYLRDLYDSSDDSAGCSPSSPTCQRNAANFNDTMARQFSELLFVIHRFPAGFDDHETNEPFTDATFSTIDERDGFRVVDYKYVYENVGTPNVDTDLQRLYNCTLL